MTRLARATSRYAAIALVLLAPLGSANGATLSPAQLLASQTLSATRIVAAEKTTPARRFTYVATSTVWATSDANGWASGYLPGGLWLATQLTNGSWQRKHAAARQAAIADLNTTAGATDIGQRYYYSLAKGYDMTGNSRYRAIALAAAGQQAARFSPVVGAVRSRNATDTYQVIMDDLMNVQLLYWGADHGGSPVWADIAHQHALTVARDFVRDDGGTFHLVCYDASTGVVVQKTTSQGYSASTTWARGQAWAIYGFTAAYRETRDPVMLETARKVADFYLKNVPDDYVPYWDFDAPGIPDAPRDSSAAAAAASGLVELSRLETDAVRAHLYEAAARATLASLASPSYASTSSAMILSHATLNYWSSTTRDCSLSFGDYFFLEALMRLRLLPSAAPPLKVKRVSASKGKPQRAVDRNPATAWVANKRQWIQLDLGKRVRMSAVGVAISGGDSRSAGFTILASTDGKHWRSACTTRSSASTISMERFDFPARTARFVRVVCNGTSRTSDIRIAELRAF